MKGFFHNYFPSYGIKNIRFYYFFLFFSNGWFVLGNWIFLWLKYITVGQIGLIDSIAFILGILLEIPSGAVSDLLGKKKTLILASILHISGLCLMVSGKDTLTLGIGNILFFSGTAFFSGSSEAFGYDSLVEYKKEKNYSLLASKFHFIELVATFLTAGIGGYLFMISPELPWYLWIIFKVIALCIIVKFKEPSVDSEVFSISTYKSQLLRGFKFLARSPIKHYAIVFILLSFVYHSWSVGIIRPLMAESFGFTGETLSYAISLILIISSVAVLLVPRVKQKLGNSLGLSLLSIILAVSFIAPVLFPINIHGGFFIILTIMVIGKIRIPWMSEVLNVRIESKERATVLSTIALITQLPYPLISLAGGMLAEKNLLGIVYILFVVLLIAAAYVSKRFIQ
ncbi:MFS transporter [Candidatus Dojkabacteria bacterium]|uniref:MFS transporter n=1 Tax=Candidatus Dojkabacteria bacterium TaxID=2099670 RepID=A0A955L8M1_9BACT|nr:MFS transporter [Candidatus Dojkabacteria bacterium]